MLACQQGWWAWSRTSDATSSTLLCLIHIYGSRQCVDSTQGTEHQTHDTKEVRQVAKQLLLQSCTLSAVCV